MTAAKLSRACGGRRDVEFARRRGTSEDRRVLAGGRYRARQAASAGASDRRRADAAVCREASCGSARPGDLERMGIVERVPNRGAMVRAYTADEIQQLYVLRNLLEGHAARSFRCRCARRTSRTSGGFRSFMTRPSQRGDLGYVFHANVNFHELLFSKTGNCVPRRRDSPIRVAHPRHTILLPDLSGLSGAGAQGALGNDRGYRELRSRVSRAIVPSASARLEAVL